MAQFVTLDIQSGVARVTINRPKLHNAFNEVVIAEITQAFAELSRSAAVRVVVLASTGKSFCAGADVNWMKRVVDYSFEENVADAVTMADMLHAIRTCPKPVIARVHGAVIGGGMGLVAACDLAVAVAGATFCLSEVKLGIVPAVVSPFVTEKIGPGHMRRYALTAERFDAAEAKRIGLISEVADSPEDMDDRIVKLCAHLKANGPQALAACKQILRDIQQSDWPRLRDLTTRTTAERRASAEGQTGLKSFLEKRTPDWK